MKNPEEIYPQKNFWKNIWSNLRISCPNAGILGDISVRFAVDFFWRNAWRSVWKNLWRNKRITVKITLDKSLEDFKKKECCRALWKRIWSYKMLASSSCALHSSRKHSWNLHKCSCIALCNQSFRIFWKESCNHCKNCSIQHKNKQLWLKYSDFHQNSTILCFIR